jgi:hypothetical protein
LKTLLTGSSPSAGIAAAAAPEPARLLPLLWSQLHVLMEQAGGEHWRIGRWLALAVDGSRVTTPHTKSNWNAREAK